MYQPAFAVYIELDIMKPILAVAIPAHNEEKYIGRCIESITASACLAGQPVEVVVALNRCTDSTQAIAESLVRVAW